MRKIKLVIQNGHENSPNGQTGTAGELDLIKKVFYEIKKIIDSQYSSIIALYYDDASCQNAPNMDYFLATHFDGAINKSYNGGFVDCNPDSYTKDKDWEFARLIADNYFNEMGIRFAPEHRTANSTYYYGFNHTGQNTIQTLIELGTLTNDSDKAKCQDVGKIARLLVKGMVSYFEKYDTNYKEYIQGQTTESCETALAKLRVELAQQKEKFRKLQQDTSKQLADKETECQLKISRLKQDIVSFINNYK